MVHYNAGTFYWVGLTDGRTGKWEWVNQTPYIMNRRWVTTAAEVETADISYRLLQSSHPMFCMVPGAGNLVSPTAGPVTVWVQETRTALTFTVTEISTTFTVSLGCATSARETGSVAERAPPPAGSARHQGTTQCSV